MPIALSHFIDVARWVAALAVMLGHAAFISLPDIMTAPHGPGVYVWWFMTAFWHQAVIVFFVISGFLVGGKAFRLSRGDAPFLRDYLIDRFSRIYIVFAPALALGVFVDTLGRHVFAGAGIYEWPAWDGVFAPSHVFAALFQLQSIWSGPVGTNGPLWSLACEFWYYIVFPLLLAPLCGAYSARIRIALFFCGLGLLIFLFNSAELFSVRLRNLGARRRHQPGAASAHRLQMAVAGDFHRRGDGDTSRRARPRARCAPLSAICRRRDDGRDFRQSALDATFLRR